ncbi:MAG TPA: AI-2E family transporter, partial [Novosphingobium sp.]
MLVSLAFIAMLTPLLGPVLWGTAVTLLFYPVHLALGRRTRLPANAVAGISLAVIVLTAVVPTLLVATLITTEASAVLGQLNVESLELATVANRLRAVLPDWIGGLLGPAGQIEPQQVQVWAAGTLNAALRSLIASAPGLGQLAFGYLVDLAVMLYLTFFLLRDGVGIARIVEQSLPLEAHIRLTLRHELVSVVRATLKSSLAIAVLQGTLGGIVFYLLDIRAPVLWGTAMGFMSLLPTIGTGVVWVPVALYLLATGAVWQGLTLAFCGLFVIGTVDNFVRP